MLDRPQTREGWIARAAALTTPFGGFRQSGFGRDRSPHAIDKYTDLKTVRTSYRR